MPADGILLIEGFAVGHKSLELRIFVVVIIFVELVVDDGDLLLLVLVGRRLERRVLILGLWWGRVELAVYCCLDVDRVTSKL